MAKEFKNISVAEEDWSEYEQIAAKLSKKLGVQVSLPKVVRKAMDLLKKDLEERDDGA